MWENVIDYFVVSPDPHLTLPISVLLVVRAWNPGDLFHSLPPCFSSNSISLPKYLSNLLPFLTSFSITGVQAMGAAVGTAEKSPPCSPLPTSLCPSSTPICPRHFSAWNPSGPPHYSWDDSVTFPQGPSDLGRYFASRWELCFRLLDLLSVPWMSQASFVWIVLLCPTTSFFTLS